MCVCAGIVLFVVATMVPLRCARLRSSRVWLAAVCMACCAAVGTCNESSKWSQIITASETEYVKERVYNATTLKGEFGPEEVASVSIKPPPRFGHTLTRIGHQYGTKKFFNEALMFGGQVNGTRGDLWKYRAGMVNSNKNFLPEDDKLRLYDGRGQFGTAEFACSQSKVTNKYTHICNTWKKEESTIVKKQCATSLPSKQLFLLKVQGLCLEANQTFPGYSGVSPGNAVVAKTCDSTFYQRIDM